MFCMHEYNTKVHWIEERIDSPKNVSDKLFTLSKNWMWNLENGDQWYLDISDWVFLSPSTVNGDAPVISS